MKDIERINLSFPADKKYLSMVGTVVLEICNHVPGLPPSSAYNIQLAVDEAVVNVISHAYKDDPSGVVELTLEIWLKKLAIRIRDWGLSFDPSAVPEPDLNRPQERGYGVYLIRTLMDQVTYEENSTDGNCVTLVKMLS